MSDWELDCIKWWGTVLLGRCKHWCPEWDDLPIDEFCSEFACCGCTFEKVPAEYVREHREARQDQNDRANSWLEQVP